MSKVRATVICKKENLQTLINASRFMHRLQNSHILGLPYQALFHMQNGTANPEDQFYSYGSIYSWQTALLYSISSFTVCRKIAHPKLQILRRKIQTFFPSFHSSAFF